MAGEEEAALADAKQAAADAKKDAEAAAKSAKEAQDAAKSVDDQLKPPDGLEWEPLYKPSDVHNFVQGAFIGGSILVVAAVANFVVRNSSSTITVGPAEPTSSPSAAPSALASAATTIQSTQSPLPVPNLNFALIVLAFGIAMAVLGAAMSLAEAVSLKKKPHAPKAGSSRAELTATGLGETFTQAVQAMGTIAKGLTPARLLIVAGVAVVVVAGWTATSQTQPTSVAPAPSPSATSTSK